MTRLPATAIDKGLGRLRRELLRLASSLADKPIARRNARRRVLSSMRLLRAAVDREYPAVIVAKERKRRAPQDRMRVLTKAGWKIASAEVVAVCAAEGITVKRVVWNDYEMRTPAPYYVSGKGWVTPAPTRRLLHTATRYFIPGWAAAIGTDDLAHLRAAKRSRIMRHAALAAQALA